jgi:uncharacterized membrane protein YqjE
MEKTRVPNGDNSKPGVGELVHRITDDVKTIAGDELKLAKMELTRTVKTAVTDAAVVVLGGIVALIGFGMLCVVAVVALAPVISALWLRLLLMAAIYLAVGGGIAASFAKKLATDAKPDLSNAAYEAKATVENIKEGLQG